MKFEDFKTGITVYHSCKCKPTNRRAPKTGVPLQTIKYIVVGVNTRSCEVLASVVGTGGKATAPKFYKKGIYRQWQREKPE